MSIMLRNIYLKEMKDSFRDRRTLLLTVLLPIIMMTGLTLFYEKMITSDEGGSYTLAVSDTISAEEEMIFTGFDNIEFIKSVNPEEALKNGDAQAALILSPDFMNKVKQGEEASATIIGDSFSQNSSQLIGLVTSAFSAYEKTVISNRLLEQGTDPKVVQPFAIIQQEMAENPGINLVAMLIPLILAIAIGIGAGPSASDLFAGEKERKTMEALLMTPVNRGTLVLAKWLTISSIGSITGIITLVVVALEINFLTENLKQAISYDENILSIIGLAVLISVIYAMFTASLLMLTSIIGKTVKESQSYSTPVTMLAVFPVMITSSMGVNEFSFYHFAIPILNIFAQLKELLFGVIDFEHLFITLASNLICMIAVFIIGRILFMKDKWVMN